MSTNDADAERIMDALSRAKTNVVAVSAHLKFALALLDTLDEKYSLKTELSKCKLESDKIYMQLSAATELLEKTNRTR
ncbi:MAG TPA: hypothetical protein V6C97_23695 [Oculatellaceae cyanobacterium]